MTTRVQRWAGILVVLLILNTAYLAAFALPTIFYMSNVLLHVILGILMIPLVLHLWWKQGPTRRRWSAAFFFFLGSGALGIYLIERNTSDHRYYLWAHMAAGALALAAFLPAAIGRDSARTRGQRSFTKAYVSALIVLLLLPLGAALYRRAVPDDRDRIENGLVVPVSMDEEGGGPGSPFFPSSARTNVGGTIPSDFFMESEKCGECHKDIYDQWNGSAHHFSSFNNQFYRKSIEYMQDVVGTRPSRWCAGCHDHAVFFNGRFDTPIREQVDTPEARAGMACTSCHAITQVHSSLGNADFTISYPPLHRLASSDNPIIHGLDRFLTFTDPEPHRKTFLKPFMHDAQSPEFCSTCHKVHMDVPVNDYRWLRGFNEYDNWQASGVSGQGARSFYYPAQPSTCIDCHMPLVDSRDPGNINGKVHSHRFPGANTALPFVNKDDAQMKAVLDFLQSGFITVDIFAVSPVEDSPAQTPMLRRSGEVPQIMTTFAVGEEAEVNPPAVIREVGKIAAPVGRTRVTVAPGETLNVDVVVRTRKIGHFFPGGTVDAFDVWLELQGKDATGRTIFWSGKVEDDGRGPVEPGAHFYTALMLDGASNPIDKRNAYQARSLLYAHLIPPGAADVAHYRVHVPKDVRGPISFTARLNYRKFSYYYTQFSYAGQPKPGQDPTLVTKGYNSLQYSFDPANIPADVSGNIKGEIPNLPIVTLASAQAQIPVGETGEGRTVAENQDRERWNDWGIGLLLQGDLKGAEFAFNKVTEADPGYADGWLNVARALIQEGETDKATPFVDKALALNPNLGAGYFFKAMIEKACGDYDAALASLHEAESRYPLDRVVLNQMARILFLKRQYSQALEVLKRVCAIDPEDLQMHYTMMLCYSGLGDREHASREEALFRRFKAEESSQQLTARRRMLSPEDNNERQLIHEHESVDLGIASALEPLHRRPPSENKAALARADGAKK